MSPLSAGDPAQIGGFRLVARLGAGGMGVVYVGTDQAGRPAAVKSIKAEHAADPQFRARFRREVAAARAVAGSCTARVLDADPEAAQPWLATEYVGGASLYDVVNADGPFGDHLLHPLATGLAEALCAIHDAGVVHRDLKPANVLLASDGPKVIDFGIAALEAATVSTRTGVGLGSPGYMAPEQITGASAVGPAVDVYAWGLTVLFAATGEPPFGRAPAQALFYRAVHAEIDLSGLPAWIEPLVRAAVDREPQNRPTAHDLLNELTRNSFPATAIVPAVPVDATQRILEHEWQQPSAARSPQLPANPIFTPGMPHAPVTKDVSNSRRPYALGAVGLLALAGVLAGAFFLLPDGGSANNTAPTDVTATGGAEQTNGPATEPTAEPTAEPTTEPSTTTTSEAPIQTPAGNDDYPFFAWDLGTTENSTSFLEFTRNFNGQIVRIASTTASTEQTNRYFVPRPGDDSDYDDPHFSLFTCPDLPAGEEPGFPPDSPCEATTYLLDLDGDEPGDAQFVGTGSNFVLEGYFEVEYEDEEDGVTEVKLIGLNEDEDLDDGN
nr:serine/threonine-protein kinase [Kineosporia babensis]